MRADLVGIQHESNEVSALAAKYSNTDDQNRADAQLFNEACYTTCARNCLSEL